MKLRFGVETLWDWNWYEQTKAGFQSTTHKLVSQGVRTKHIYTSLLHHQGIIMQGVSEDFRRNSIWNQTLTFKSLDFEP